MRTLPSIEALGEAFSCTPRIESTHPELGVLKYEVEYETEEDRISLSVLPVAEEVNVSLFTKRPPRIIRLGLEDVSSVLVENDKEDTRVAITFHNTEMQALSLSLKPTVLLFWGNQHDSPDRSPPWERTDATDP
jgi:hypothetical protein